MAGPTTLYQTGVHGSRPAASAGCVLYSCTTHSKVYKSDGSAWSDWITIPTGASVATDAIFDAAGDLVQGTGADTAAKLSAVATGKVLVSQGVTTAVAWGYPPFHGAKAYRAGTQSVLTGAEDTILFDTEEYDTDAFHDTGSNTGRFTIPTGMGGYYRCTASMYGASGLTTNASAFSFYKNASTAFRGHSQGDVTTVQNEPFITAVVNLAAGDYVQCKFFNGTAGTIVIGHASAAGVQSTMSIELIGV